jgi:hypothetical protein
MSNPKKSEEQSNVKIQIGGANINIAEKDIFNLMDNDKKPDMLKGNKQP